MTFRYRVTLTGIKGFFRVYNVNSSNSLYSFHKQMRSDMDFPQDQLILFKGLDEEGNVVARYGLFDLGNGAVDTVTVEDTIKAGIHSFVYFYDVTNKKSVNVTFEGEVPGIIVSVPVLSESKGPDPIEFENGYVAFEDLPDDKRRLPGEEKENKNSLASLLGLSEDDDEDDEDDEDEVDEDEDDEEGEEIYDEDELTI